MRHSFCDLPTRDLRLLLLWCAGVGVAGVYLLWRSVEYFRGAVGIAVFLVVWGPIAVASFRRGLPAWRELRRRAREASGRCVHCGYDLTGNTSGVCPECGSGTPVHE
jgi:hypothetical protein